MSHLNCTKCGAQVIVRNGNWCCGSCGSAGLTHCVSYFTTDVCGNCGQPVRGLNGRYTCLSCGHNGG